MKLIFLLLSFCFGIKAQDANGCGGPHMYTSNGINYNYLERTGQTATITSLDTFMVHIYNMGHSMCKSYKDLKIELENETIISGGEWQGNGNFALKGLPGHYKVECKWWGVAFWHTYVWEFDLILKQNDWVSVASYEDNTSLFSIYPNPAKELVYIESREEFLKEIALFNLSGEKIVELKVEALKTTVPLQDIAPGIYFLMVSTLSEKTSIKKFVRL